MQGQACTVAVMPAQRMGVILACKLPLDSVRTCSSYPGTWQCTTAQWDNPGEEASNGQVQVLRQWLASMAALPECQNALNQTCYKIDTFGKFPAVDAFRVVLFASCLQAHRWFSDEM